MEPIEAIAVFSEGDTFIHPTLGILTVMEQRKSGSVLACSCEGNTWLFSQDLIRSLAAREEASA